jgi:hypothetical protein
MIRFAQIDPQPEEAQHLWELIQPLKAYAMDDGTTFNTLVTGLNAPNAAYFYAIEDEQEVGYCSFTNLTMGQDAYAHALFFDKKMMGRGERFNRLVKKIMARHQLLLMRAIVPQTHRGTVVMLKRMGWQQDGIYRNYIMRDGAWLDGVLFTVSQEELHNGRHVWRRETKEQSQNQNGTPNPSPARIHGANDADEPDAGRGEATNVPGISWNGWSPSWVRTTPLHDAADDTTHGGRIPSAA